MFISFFFLLSFSISITMLLMMNPLSLGFWVLMLALMVALLSGIYTSSWLGFIIFLIYIGGMLVMFAYFASIQPNQFVSLMKPLMVLFIVLMSMMLLMPSESILFPAYGTFEVSAMYQFLNIPILLMSAFLLFLAMVAVVKVSLSNLGSLRTFSE